MNTTDIFPTERMATDELERRVAENCNIFAGIFYSEPSGRWFIGTRSDGHELIKFEQERVQTVLLHFGAAAYITYDEWKEYLKRLEVAVCDEACSQHEKGCEGDCNHDKEHRNACWLKAKE